MNRLLNWFYSTRLGGYYFGLLLWLDRIKNTREKLAPGAIAQIIRQYSLLGEGVKAVKRQINSRVQTKNKDGYHEVLKNTEDLMVYAKRDADDPKSKYAEMFQNSPDLKKNIDIETATDKAKMIEGRIKDYQELRKHKEKRAALREARKATHVKRS